MCLYDDDVALSLEMEDRVVCQLITELDPRDVPLYGPEALRCMLIAAVMCRPENRFVAFCPDNCTRAIERALVIIRFLEEVEHQQVHCHVDKKTLFYIRKMTKLAETRYGMDPCTSIWKTYKQCDDQCVTLHDGTE